MRAYVVVSALALVVLSTAAFRQASTARNLGEITVGGGNWEAAGVTPEVKTTAAEALSVAHARALRGLIDRELPGPRPTALERVLKTVEGR
jgi:hypothetical protein